MSTVSTDNTTVNTTVPTDPVEPVSNEDPTVDTDADLLAHKRVQATADDVADYTGVDDVIASLNEGLGDSDAIIDQYG